MKKKTSYKEKTPAELTKMLVEMRGALRNIRFAAAGARPADSSAHGKTRTEIARVLTELATREKKSA